MFRRMAFHQNGKPRGWFRALAISKSNQVVRPLFRRAFFKKNGKLRPDIAAFVKQNPHYFRNVFNVGVGINVGAGISQDDVARQIFASQQSELTSETAEELISGFTDKPLVSIIMPVYKTPVQWLRRAVKSLQDQYYENWELCVVDDCSPGDEQRRLLEDMAKDDPRIRLAVTSANGGISATSNMALEMADGEFLALVDHDDELTPDALLRMVEAINVDPVVDFLYSDECKIGDTPERKLFDFVLKPDWSPEIMFNFMITGHLTVYRTNLVRQIGGFRSAYDFSQDYDLALRMAEEARKIVHVERILYLWRAIRGSAAAGGKNFARETNVAALDDALHRRGIIASVDVAPYANRVRVSIPNEGSHVSIVIPSDSAKNLRLAIDAIRGRTDYDRYEVCVVCNSSVATELEAKYQEFPAIKFIRYDKPYNFSDKCNEGARKAEGDIVVFYNDDVFPIERDWLDRLIEYLWVPGVGATSPQLLYGDNTIQYAGMISGTPGMAGTAFHKLPRDNVDSFLSMNRLVRNISILSGACCAMRRDLFLKIGGFDAINTPDGHSDLDLSYKVMAEGLRCVYTPYSLLNHIGNHSWNAKGRKYKADVFCLKRWGCYLSSDSYFTSSMKRVLYADFNFNYRIYADHIDPKAIYTGPDVLFVSHQLTNTGAPHMLLEAAKAVKATGGFPVVVAPTDGPLRSAFEREGIVVIIDESVAQNHFLFERFARNFDLVVVNTVVMRPVVEQLAKALSVPILWWLHESEMLSGRLNKLRPSFGEQVSVVCVSEYAKSFVAPDVNVRVLYNGIPDYKSAISSAYSDQKLTFLMVGTIEPRKGQDLFVQAILDLPPSMRANCRFVMAGKVWPPLEPFWNEIKLKIGSHPEIVFAGDLPHEKALGLIGECDVLVCCSRDEAFGMVVVEAAQMGKPSIISDRTGVREVLDADSSFVFVSGDVRALRARMIEVYKNQDSLQDMGRSARRIYEERLTQDEFARNFNEMVDSEIARL